MRPIQHFLLLAASLTASVLPAETILRTTANRVVEWTLASARDRSDPFATVDLDAHVSDAAGRVLLVPGYWAGGRTWRFRFASPIAGTYRFQTECSDQNDTGLHG